MFAVSLRKEMLEQWRSRRLLIVVVVFVLFGLASPLLAKMTPEFFRLLPQGDQIARLLPPPTLSDAVAQYLKNLFQFGVLLAILLAMGAVSQEKERGTAALILVKPMSRGAFLMGKFAAIGTSFLIATVLAGAGAYYYTVLLFRAPPLGGWIALNLLLLLVCLVYVALTLCFSALARSQVTAAVAGFGAMLVLSLAGSLPAIGTHLPHELINWGSRLVLGGSKPAWTALLSALVLIALPLALGWLSLSRQEF